MESAQKRQKAESAQKVESGQKAESVQMMKQHNVEEKHITIRHFYILQHNNKAFFDTTYLLNYWSPQRKTCTPKKYSLWSNNNDIVCLATYNFPDEQLEDSQIENSKRHTFAYTLYVQFYNLHFVLLNLSKKN